MARKTLYDGKTGAYPQILSLFLSPLRQERKFFGLPQRTVLATLGMNRDPSEGAV